MINYLLKILALAIFSFIIIYFYYSSNPAHIENFDGYILYIILIGLFYGIYKYLQLEFSEKEASFSLLKILLFFLFHLLVLSILFFYYNNEGIASLVEWIRLFFKIILFSLLPLLIIFTSIWFWSKISSYLPSLKKETSIYRFIISIWIWFFSFVFLLDIIGMLGFYNLYVVFILLVWMITFSYKELISLFKSFISYKINIDIEEWSYLRLISTEFLFIVSTLVLSISLISIVRPFPIGWDDLWVYMNYPHLMAEAGSIISLWGMYAWQTFTGIWYMFWNPTQAFFLNVVGWFLSFIILTLITSDLLKTTSNSKTKTFINIPLLVWTTFIALPMIVFQQAKDMKLDPGLFFISIIALYLLFKYYLRLNNKSYLEKVKWFVNDKILHKWFNVSNLLIIFVIWLLAWFAFSIKFTTLLLISAIIWVIFFARLGFIWFLGYLAIFFAMFTKAWLWSMMNVVVNPNKIAWFETTFFISSWLIWIILLVISFLKNKWVVKKFFLEFWIFLLWIFIALSPWLAKNIVDSSPQISIWSIIGWKSERFIADYTKIYTSQELKIKEEEIIKWRGLDESGTTTNEDFWRYFGYEEWINNYIKLPWNLTMQYNQWWEFTDIWFLFLALLPVLLLFLPFRKKYYSFLIVVILILELLIFVSFNNKLIESNKISTFSKTAQTTLFIWNNNVFVNKISNKDIYDIKISNYISKEEILSLVTPENDFNSLSRYISDIFYKELKQKVLNEDLWKEISLPRNMLIDKDYELIKELRVLYNSLIKFNPNIDSIVKLDKSINKLWIENERDAIVSLWKENRTYKQFFTDFFSKFDLPFGYVIILLIFLLPVFALLSFIKTEDKDEKAKIQLFKLNLIFATFYTFLWVISAFWIVWYWIAMYFSFLLTIAIGIYYLSSYNDENDEKIFFTKMFGSIIVSFIFIIYFINSVFPHSFNNLKWAGYKEYKTGIITTINAPYLYHKEYLKILFHTNIAKEKRSEFLEDFISSDIKKAVNGIEDMDIYMVKDILTQIANQTGNIFLSNEAKKSLNNIYWNISNPTEKYKSNVWIYRIGTFLRYHISENHKRLLEDSLIFNFNNYIYDSNIDTTIENMKKIWLWYLLVDLNAATIDKDERRNLTARFEKLLSTFTSDKLELIETDSICLKIALEDFKKSEKFSEDRIKFLEIAGVNYESYTKDGIQINRWVKLKACYNRISELIDAELINKENYSYLLDIKNFIVKQNDKSQIFSILKQTVNHGYKVLFEIK